MRRRCVILLKLRDHLGQTNVVNEQMTANDLLERHRFNIRWPASQLIREL